ncbi:L,D-transpeptidase catalytic domain [Chryseobacterium sp. RU37D]|uniref:L,D-transpeptidase family protein n=1 Tax=Chryseobacterium sp. RU37D TaxID=1907397 RepID=UPI0009549EDC|nr:L,D-transpeptidase family protein [Chryseobacterium sp. RU37D]SIQ76205.1 L,D-transpeptidase catalytic domain [Chryseobacterium sp. RU37D]
MKKFINFAVLFFCTVYSSIVSGQNTKTNPEITLFLKDNACLSTLHFPKSVIRFYTRNDTEYAWVNVANKPDQSEAAVLLLEYSYRFGLSLSDYYRDVVSLEKLRKLGSISAGADMKGQAMFDILMTDALITFINNLHFGKYNPSYSPSYIDTNYINKFRSDDVLQKAKNDGDFVKSVLEVQPKIKAYKDFQNYLNIFYSESHCTETQAGLEKIIMNMERLRWISIQNTPYILINIPSYTLEFHQKDKTYDFKVIIGKPSSKTPLLESSVNYFTTAPDWKVPQDIFVKEMLPKILKNSRYLADHHYTIYDEYGNEVVTVLSKLSEIRRNPYRYSVRQSSGYDNALGAVVFRFPNSYGVYLHDTSQKQLFNKNERAFSHGCIRIENAKELASLLLKNDGAENNIPVLEAAMKDYKRKDFVLKHPVPIITVYLTCLIKDGKPFFYEDIYHLDPSLENKFSLNK